MKIQLVAFSAILALCTATSAYADDDLDVDNDSTNAVAIGGNGGFGPFFPNTGSAGGASGSSFSNERALAGSVLVKGCDCDDDVTIDNTSVNALAVGKSISGSVVLR